MTNIQMLLALGAMILLTILLLNVNKNSLYTEEIMYGSNFGITATSIAASIIEDASKKYYDHKSDTMLITTLNDLTPSSNLGPDTLGINPEDASNPATFNDFDDYKGYTTVDSTMPSAWYNVSCDVRYVNPSTPDTPINNESWHKKITVKVWSNSMQDTLIMSQIFSYWNLR